MLSPGLGRPLERCGHRRDFRKGKKPSDHAPLLVQLDAAADGITIPDASDSKQV